MGNYEEDTNSNEFHGTDMRSADVAGSRDRQPVFKVRRKVI